MIVHDLYNIKQLFSKLGNGDDSAFKTIFELYKKKVFLVGLKMLKSDSAAEEIVQDVFLCIWTAKGRMAAINDPEAYLFTITYNTIYAHLKRTSRNQELLNTLLRRLTEIQNTTEDTIAANETSKLIHQAIQQLSPQQRTVYQLNKQEGLSYEEIAEHMKISRNTVRNHLAEAMKAIRLFLKKTALLFIALIAFLIK